MGKLLGTSYLAGNELVPSLTKNTASDHLWPKIYQELPKRAGSTSPTIFVHLTLFDRHRFGQMAQKFEINHRNDSAEN